MTAESRRVVVGVSSMDGWQLVRWAATEASARQAELRLVTAVPHGVAAGHDAASWRLLDGMANHVAAACPDLAVGTELVAGRPAVVLRAAAEDATLLVVGADDASPFMEAISGSVPGDLLTTAPCPLAVLPRREWTTPASAPVVAAIDETDAALAALDYAHTAASRAGRPLTILRCVTPGHITRTAPVPAYQDVAVTIEIAEGDPGLALAAASRAAEQLVLGSRGRLTSGLFGSVSRTLIRRSHCPVVIARGPHTTRQHTTAAS